MYFVDFAYILLTVLFRCGGAGALRVRGRRLRQRLPAELHGTLLYGVRQVGAVPPDEEPSQCAGGGGRWRETLCNR